MRTKKLLAYATPLVSVLFFNTAPMCFGSDSQLDNDIKAYEDKPDSQATKLQEQYAREEQEELDRAQSDADKLVDQIRQKANDDVSATPQYVHEPGSYVEQNGNFANDVAYIRQQEEERVKNIYEQLRKQQAYIKQVYEQKISGLGLPKQAAANQKSPEINSRNLNL